MCEDLDAALNVLYIVQNPDIVRLALGVREDIVNISVAGDVEQIRESQLQTQSILQSDTMDESSINQDTATAQLHEPSLHERELASPMSEFARSVESEGDETNEDTGVEALEVHHIIMHAG